MNREAFEKWKNGLGKRPLYPYAQPSSSEVTIDMKAAEYMFTQGYQAATEATNQWTPYKDGDVVEDGCYEVTTLDRRDSPFVWIASFRDGEWYVFTALAQSRECVTAYRKLPEPYVPEVE